MGRLMSDEPIVLALESATSVVGCAVGGAGGALAAAWSARGRRHAESLAPQIEFVTRQAGVALGELAAIAVDVGPGLYTGLRVGVTTAMTMAHALHIPVVEVASTDVIAEEVGPQASRIDVAIDARRGEVFHAAYEPDGGALSRISDPAVVTPAELRSILGAVGGTVVLAGDGAQAHPDVLGVGAGVRHADVVHPRADVLVRMAAARLGAGDTTAPELVRPRYLRRPDAVAKWEART